MLSKFNVSQNWRNFFEESGLNNKSYKLFIETAYGCHADCFGCPIPKESRAAKDPKWDLNKLEPILSNFGDNLLNWRKENNLPNIENLAITVGPAENLIFSEEYLIKMANVSKGFAKKINTKEFHLSIATSGLFSVKKVEPKIKALKSILNNNELALAWVFNIRQFAKTPKHYYAFAEYIFENIDLVELEINLDNNIYLLNNDLLKEFGNFVSSFPFVQLDFAYAINDGNTTKTYLNNEEFIDFIEKTRNFSGSLFKKYFSQWDQNLFMFSEEDFVFDNEFNVLANNILNKSIRLNAMGEWHFAQNILGNFYYDENFEQVSLGDSNSNPYSEEAIEKFIKNYRKFLYKQLATHHICDQCKYKNICVSSGYINYVKYSDKNEKYCTNPGFTVFNRNKS
jgi:hypothetical protein